MNILFSIITVSYNSEKTIERTIQSILKQSYENFEYIVVDGKSSDATISIVDSYLLKFNGRLHYISEADSGIYNAMNKGISRAKGDIVAIVNSDDWLENNALQIVADNIQSHALNLKTPFLIAGQMNFHYDNGTIQVMKTNEKKYLYYAKQYRMGLNHPATFVSRITYDIVGVFDENLKLYADCDFILRCKKMNVQVCFLDDILTNMADGGASNVYSSQGIKDRRYVLHKYARNRMEYYSMLTSAYVIRFIELLTPYSLKKLIRKRRNS